MNDFASKKVLVTGASRGIGQAVAAAFVAQGALVVATATSASGLEKIQQNLGEQVQAKVLDLGNSESIQMFLQQLEQENLWPDILINNAGITRDGLLMRMAESDWQQVLTVNLSSLFHLCKACIRPMMKARSGRIINIASVVAVMGNAGQTNYAAAKAGMIGFSKALAREVASRNITVNCLAPGFIATDMTEELTEAQKNSILAQVPAGRLGSAQEIAAAALFLASASAAYITGETLHINGGMYML